MDHNEYFENLTHGKAGESGAEENTPEEMTEMGTFQVELAKAAASAMASRSTKTGRGAATGGAKANVWDDSEPEGQLTVDVYQTPDEIVVESAIAGVKPEDLDINVTGDSISIRGARGREEQVEEGDYLYQECYWGRFTRSIILPQEIDPEAASVTLKNGILTIRLPKVNKKKAHKLRVRID